MPGKGGIIRGSHQPPWRKQSIIRNKAIRKRQNYQRINRKSKRLGRQNKFVSAKNDAIQGKHTIIINSLKWAQQ